MENCRISVDLIGVFFVLLFAAATAQGREIADMAGRHVTIPDRILKVYAAQPYTYVLVSVVAPDLLVGLPGPLNESERRFVRPGLAALPLLNSGGGNRSKPDIDAVLALHPDIILLKGGPQTETTPMLERFSKTGLPVVFVDIDSIEGYASAIEFTGSLLDRTDRAGKLAAYARRVLADVDRTISGIPFEKRVRVYYAESADGLSTECDQSFHADAIKTAGGSIVHHCAISRHIGMEKVTFEQVLAYDPDFIVAGDPAFAETVKNNSCWQQVRAVNEGHVVIVPRSPFNWIDRPPSIMRVMGVQFLARAFYPQRFPLDLRAATREFQQLFFGVTPDDADIDGLLQGMH